MRIGKIAIVSVVTLASLIVIAAAILVTGLFVRSRASEQQDFPAADSQQAISPIAKIALISQASGASSFLYREDLSTGAKKRLTQAPSGIESEPSFSRDGRLVVYSFAQSPESNSSIWVVGADGQDPHQITGKDQDAMHPVFSPDGSSVFYAASAFTGHYSPVVNAARHGWDLFSVPLQSGALVAGAGPTQITHGALYDLKSLDVAGDGSAPGELNLLVSTTGYPIGDLIEEFNLGSPEGDKIFQPHVPGESFVGPSYGEARFIHNGMDVVFLAASNKSGGKYDYNVYSMSDATGHEIKQLTHLKGMTTELRVLDGDSIAFRNGEAGYELDIKTGQIKPLD